MSILLKAPKPVDNVIIICMMTFLINGYKCVVYVVLARKVAADRCRCLGISLRCYCDSDGWGDEVGDNARFDEERERQSQCGHENGMISFS